MNISNMAVTNPAQITRVTSVSTSAAPTPNCDTTDIYNLYGLASGATFSAAGTPKRGQKLIVWIRDNNNPQVLSWGANFKAGSEIALPLITVPNVYIYLGFIWNPDSYPSPIWDLIAKVSV